MLAVTYYGEISDPPVTEYLTVGYAGYAGHKAARTLYQIAEKSGIKHGGLNVRSIDEMAENMNACNPPINIEYRQDGKFHRIIRRNWNANEKTARTGVSQAVA